MKTASEAACSACKKRIEKVEFRCFEAVFCPDCADSVTAKIDRASRMPVLPYRVIRQTLKQSGLSTAGDACIAPGGTCRGHLVFDPVMRCHRCDACGYGF